MSAGWIIAVAVGVAITLTAAHFNRADLARNYIIPVISPIFAVFICWPLFRFKARVLATDDPLGLQCIEMAERAGVKVKKVIVLKTKVANAGVTAFGVLFLTTTLLEKLDAAELRAIIAHELGHLRTGRVRRISAISLSFFIVMLAFSHLLQWLLARHARNPVATFHYWQFVPIAFLFLFMMAISPYRRRDEYMADAFALEMIGDPDLVIRAIKKVHALNQSPSKLTPEDEAISTHPSLVKRLDALRAKCPVNNESAGGTTAA